MMRRWLVTAAMLGGMFWGGAAQAATAEGHAPAAESRPMVAKNARWAGSLVGGIAALFIAAAVIGILGQRNEVDEPSGGNGHGSDHHGDHH